MTCHRGGGCDLDAICAALKMTVADLHEIKLTRDDAATAPHTRAGKSRATPKALPRATSTPSPSTARNLDGGANATPKLTLTDTWSYYDADGTLAFQKRRFVDPDGKKTFRQRRPDGHGGWINSLGDITQVLYRLPQVLSAKSMGDTIWVTEGEKDADTIVAQHFEATTMPGGAGKWRAHHTEALAGAHTVIVVADNDGPGLTHALAVCAALEPVVGTVHLLKPPDPHKDVTDALDAGLTLDTLVEVERSTSGTPAPDGLAIVTVAQTDADAHDALATQTVAHTPPDDAHFEERPPDAEPPDLTHIEVAADEWDRLLDAINTLLEDDDLTEAQRLLKAGRLLERHFPDDGAYAPEVLRWEDFVRGDDDPYDWVIPGVLERGERVMVVAEEGAGKTYLMRQVALCAAAGIQPFTKSSMAPIRTLTVDLENPERIIRRTSRQIVETIHTFTHVSPDAHLVIRPAGLDLLRAPDRNWLEQAIEETKPDLVCMGPIYKTFVDPGGRTSESVAVQVVKYLDDLRTEYRFSWWLEHHAPLGDSMRSRDLRPFGSAVWSRWPEFGLALHHDPTETEQYVYEVKHFRGERDVRHWPTKMKRGGKGNLPFEVLQFRRMD